MADEDMEDFYGDCSTVASEIAVRKPIEDKTSSASGNPSPNSPFSLPGLGLDSSNAGMPASETSPSSEQQKGRPENSLARVSLANENCTLDGLVSPETTAISHSFMAIPSDMQISEGVQNNVLKAANSGEISDSATTRCDSTGEVEFCKDNPLKVPEPSLVQPLLATTNDTDMETEQEKVSKAMVNGHSPSNAHVSHDSEAMDISKLSTEIVPEANGERDPEAEFEIDSSPYESSSDDSSTSSSDNSDDDYELLDAAEQARRLMADDGASDDEGAQKGAKGAPLRTHNEKPDEVVEKPAIVVTADMKIEELGKVETTVDNVALIKGTTSGEFKVLEASSLLCLEDRTVIGVVSETLGRVQEPLYCTRFSNAMVLQEAGVTKGVKIFYVPQHSTFVFTKAIQGMKGSDASNIHDEEVAVDEAEFSDDEAEAEYKRNLKSQRLAKRSDRGNPHSENARRGGSNGAFNRASRGPVNDGGFDRTIGAINYDDGEAEEDLYTPLVRPANLQDMIMQNGTSSELSREVLPRDGGSRGGRGGRGRGDRSRGRGRGRGERRSFNNSRGHQNSAQAPDLSLPPTPNFGFSMSPTSSQAGLPQPLDQSFQAMQPVQPFRSMQPVQPFQHTQPVQPFPQAPPPHSQYPSAPFPPTFQEPLLHNEAHHQHSPQISQGPYSINDWPAMPQQAYQYPHGHFPRQGQGGSQHHVQQSPTYPVPPGASINPRFFQGQYQQNYNPGPPNQ